MRGYERMLLAALCAVTLLTACNGRRGLQPSSGGRPYEVLVVGDRDSTVARALSEDVPGLPQPEPAFDVSTCDSAHFKNTLRLARAIVIVTIDPQAASRLRMRYEKDVWAQPQTVVYITAADTKMLESQMARQATALCNLLTRAEINAELTRLKHHRNIDMERKVNRMSGLRIMIPEEMTASKSGRDFLWMSNNGTQTMTNIAIYRADKAMPFTAARDSALRKNILGETDAMYMATVPTTMAAQRETLRGQRVTVYRGLWQMKGDAMGGPFVARRIGDWIVEAFVYAPGKEKRNTMRRLEAALMSEWND